MYLSYHLNMYQCIKSWTQFKFYISESKWTVIKFKLLYQVPIVYIEIFFLKLNITVSPFWLLWNWRRQRSFQLNMSHICSISHYCQSLNNPFISWVSLVSRKRGNSFFIYILMQYLELVRLSKCQLTEYQPSLLTCICTTYLFK